MAEVVTKQYLMADTKTMTFLLNLALTSESARNAMCLLSALHIRCMRLISPVKLEDDDGNSDSEILSQIDKFYARVKVALDAENSSSNTYTEGDAMAGLHVVSSFLFSGASSCPLYRPCW
jgi:C6 transcription factor Pro1